MDQDKIRILFFTKYTSQSDKIQKKKDKGNKKTSEEEKETEKEKEEEKMAIEDPIEGTQSQTLTNSSIPRLMQNFPSNAPSIHYQNSFGLPNYFHQLQKLFAPPSSRMNEVYPSNMMSPSQQIPSPSYSQESMEFGNAGTNNDRVLGLVENIHGMLFQIKQQQASTINSLNVLTHDVMQMNEQVQTLKSQSTRGTGQQRATSRGGGQSRRGRKTKK